MIANSERLNPERYREWLRDIDAALEVRRRQSYKRASELWLDIGGSEEDLVVLPDNEETSRADKEVSVQRPQGNAREDSASSGRTISQAAIQRYVQGVLSDYAIEVVTQTEVKDRILQDYPDAKVPSIRSGIAHQISDLVDQGILELVEKGKAGAPNKYRRTKEANQERSPTLGP